ncbi:MAG: alpha/beta hydrolase [Dehalococcoidales bacterium]|nr:alpha/beta hydrolase [Dehalococcoidales bacterium]
MPYVQKSITLSNNLVIPYVEQGNPGGAPLIFLHAIADSWHVFELLLSHIPQSIYAFALTQRGHGDASRPYAGYRSSDFASDLKAFMDAIHLGKATIAGASSGGFIARHFAIKYPERINKLILLGSPASLIDKPGVIEMWKTSISKMTDPVDHAFVRKFAEKTFPQSMPPDRLEKLICENLKVPAYVWKETFEGLLKDDLSYLSRIQAPTLIIWGDQDDIIPLTDQERLARDIPGSYMVVYHGVGHMVYLEEPERVATDIMNFLQNRSDNS